MNKEQEFREALAFIWSSCESIEGAKTIARKTLERVDNRNLPTNEEVRTVVDRAFELDRARYMGGHQ